jgi:hypothetical protein
MNDSKQQKPSKENIQHETFSPIYFFQRIFACRILIQRPKLNPWMQNSAEKLNKITTRMLDNS